MPDNKYVISGKGFLEELKSGRYPECVWTKSIRTAKTFTLRQANGAIEYIKKNIETHDECFVWSPFKETQPTGLYEVVRIPCYYNYLDEKDCGVLEWFTRKVSETDSDLTYLKKEKENKKSPEYYSFEEAKEVAKSKNIKILEEITRILSK